MERHVALDGLIEQLQCSDENSAFDNCATALKKMMKADDPLVTQFDRYFDAVDMMDRMTGGIGNQEPYSEGDEADEFRGAFEHDLGKSLYKLWRIMQDINYALQEGEWNYTTDAKLLMRYIIKQFELAIPNSKYYQPRTVQ